MQPATSQQALSQLQTAQAGQKSAADILQGQQQQFGVQQAGDTVTGLRGAIAGTTRLLNNIAPSVMGRTANSLVTSAQANRQVANEQAPVAQTLSQQGNDYSTALSDYDRANNRATEGTNVLLTDQANNQSYLQNLYNSLYQREQDAQQLALERDRLKASTGGGIGKYLGDNTNTAPAAASTDPIVQQAYNDVKARMDKGLSDQELMSDYLATASSAKYGNKVDLAKLQVYRQLLPKVFKTPYSFEATGGVQPSTKPAAVATPAARNPLTTGLNGVLSAPTLPNGKKLY